MREIVKSTAMQTVNPVPFNIQYFNTYLIRGMLKCGVREMRHSYAAWSHRNVFRHETHW